MRILHTSDWHLGRQFYGQSLESDHDDILRQVIRAMHEKKPDVLIIAGDIFDRAVPPTIAVRQFNDFIKTIAADTSASIVLIAGNHDSGDRIGSMSLLTDKNRVLIRGPLSIEERPLVLEDVLKAQIDAARKYVPEGARWVVTAHSFVRRMILSMRSSLAQEVISIRTFLQSKFGHVKSLQQKQSENQYLINRTSQLVDRLIFITVKDLNKLARDNTTLMKLFFKSFMPDINQYREELSVLLPKLKQLMWEFRQTDLNTKRLWAISRHLNQGESILNRELTPDELFVSPFNMQVVETFNSGVDLWCRDTCDILVEIVKKLPERVKSDQERNVDNKLIIGSYEKGIVEEVEITPNMLLPHRKEFFIAALKSNESASSYWEKYGDKTIPYVLWLQWVYTELFNDNIPFVTFSRECHELSGVENIYDIKLSVIEE